MGILRGNKRKRSAFVLIVQNAPLPSVKELACRSIKDILPQNSLKIIHSSNSDTQAKGVGFCLPQSIPNLNVCCNKAAQTPPPRVLVEPALSEQDTRRICEL